MKSNNSNKQDMQVGSFRVVEEILKKHVDRIDCYYHGGQSCVDTFLHSGFTELDALYGGFLQPGNLIVIAGGRHMGKTTFAMNIAEHVTIKEKACAAVFSLGLSADTLILRSLSSISELNQVPMCNGHLSDENMSKFVEAVTKIKDAKLFIDDTAPLSPSNLRTKVMELNEQHKLDLIIIDYLQLMTIPNSKNSRYDDVSEIVRSCKLLAKELNIPIILLSQVKDSEIKRLDTEMDSYDKRPVLSDLNGYGEIDKVADVVLFVSRDEIYNPDPDLTIDEILNPGTKSVPAEIIVGKQHS